MPTHIHNSMLELERVGDVIVATITEKDLLDQTGIDQLGQALARIVQRPGCGKLVLSFGRVEHLSSYLLCKLLRIRQRLNENGGALALCNLNPALAGVFQMVGIDNLMGVYPNEQEALLALGG